MKTLTVRLAAADDLPGVSRVRIRGWQAGYAGILADDYLAAMNIEDDLARRRKLFGELSSVFETFVAIRDDDVVGFAIVGPHRVDDPDVVSATLSEDEGEVCGLYVEPSQWGTGVGRALLRAGLDRLSERGLAPVRLWTFAENARARRFYSAAGFTPDGQTRATDRGGRAPAEIRYVLDTGQLGEAD